MRYTALDGEVSQRRISQVRYFSRIFRFLLNGVFRFAIFCRFLLKISRFIFLSDSGEILRHAVGQLRKAAAVNAREKIQLFHYSKFCFKSKFLIYRNLNEAVILILMEEQSGREDARECAGSQKKSLFLKE